MTIATGILVMVALTVVGTLAAAVAYAVLVRGRGWWRELLSAHTLPFVFMGLAVGATTFGIGLVERQAGDDALRLAVTDIEADCDDQLSLLLHVNVTDLAEVFTSTNRVAPDELRRLAAFFGVDEVTRVGPDGLILETTDPASKTGDPFFSGDPNLEPYRALLDGRRATVRQRFRPSATRTDRLVKYFGLALPGGGFLQIGYLWETFEREAPRYLLPVFEERLVGASGFCVVLDGRNAVEMDVPGRPEAKGRPASAVGFTPADLAEPLGKVFRARLFGTRCRCMAYPDTIAGRRIYAAVPLSERQGPALALAAGVAFVLLATFLAFRLVLRKFRQQQARIDALRAVEEERRAQDMALARAVQRGELRADGTHGDGYRLRAVMDAAREVGGDFYDYFTLPDGRLALAIADVSGKGIPAALFMMKSRTTLRGCVREQASLVEAVASANAQLARHNPAELFVTVWIGVWDRRTGRLEYVSAGHNPPLVKRADGTVEWLPAPRAAALGVFERAKYRAAEARLGPDDGLFLYTDGVTEAMNAAGELFGDRRLEEALAKAEYPLVPAVISAVGAFTAGTEQSDDITMLELTVEPAATEATTPPRREEQS